MNIHILPTDKPSRGYILGKCIKNLSDVKIGQFTETYYLMFDEEYFQAQNIYITSDEEIKDGDWCLYNKNHNSKNPEWELIECGKIEREEMHPISDGRLLLWMFKVIMTIDQDLIKDGVQAIDDEFLKWFVNNPSCEEVEVELVALNEYGSEISVNSYGFEKFGYKIILPKENLNKKHLKNLLKGW